VAPSIVLAFIARGHSALAELVHCLDKHPGMLRIDFRGDAMAKIENMAWVIAEILQDTFHLSANRRR
jgi:hypothetical protein